MKQSPIVKADHYWKNWFHFLMSIWTAPADCWEIMAGLATKRDHFVIKILAGFGGFIIFVVAFIILMVIGPFLAITGYKPRSAP